MKNYIFIFFVLFFYINTFSQNSYIVSKKGEKTFIDDNSVQVLFIDRRISYSLPGKTWEKYIKFEDLDYAELGSSLLKSFNLNKNKKSSVFYVYGEKDDKLLIGLQITATFSSNTRTRSFENYYLHVVDKEQMIIESVVFDSKPVDTKNNEKSKIVPLIEKYFSDCPEMMAKLDKYRGETILDIFTDTTYNNCKK